MAPSVAGRSAAFLRWMVAVAVFCAARPAPALDVNGYSATVNDRFTSGFPSSPTTNSNPGFIGTGYDLSGIGWSAASPSKGFGFITPRHYLVARHYGGSDLITLQGADGSLRNAAQAAVTDTGYGVVFQGQSSGDLAIGQLSTSIPASWQVARYSVLDLNIASATNSSYTYQPLLVAGRSGDWSGSPRLGAASVSGNYVSGANAFVTSSRSAATGVQLQAGDSGSPIFVPWYNPAGDRQLMILGNNAGASTSDNYYNSLGSAAAMNAVNAITTADGYALRVQGNVNARWTGAADGAIATSGNWAGGARTDRYVEFQAGAAVPETVNVNAATNLRGLSFTAGAGASAGFTFSGASTLTIGRGGLTNYTGLRQTLDAAIALGDHQYWDVGTGGVTARTIDTNGKLLEIAGAGTARISGAVTGAGGIALSGSRLELEGASSFTGRTWVHGGTLVVNGSIAQSSGVSLAAGATLAGSGRVAAIAGAGLVSPGNSPGILTAPSVDASGGLDFAFELTQQGAPNWSSPAASGNDVLRLTGAAPFTSPLSAENVINVFFGVTSLAAGGSFQGGFFADASADFLASVENATFAYYVLGDGLGTDAMSNGLGYYLLDTDFLEGFAGVEVQTVDVAMANFLGGAVLHGRVMEFDVMVLGLETIETVFEPTAIMPDFGTVAMVPEPGAFPLAAAGAASAFLIAKRAPNHKAKSRSGLLA